MTRQVYRGITWDHPRGYAALEAASQLLRDKGSDLQIERSRQPLEGFESHPIADLAQSYDLIILDHPHLGDALRCRCLQPLQDIFDEEFVAALEADSIGSSFRSYSMNGLQWAMPLDAATQVMALRPDLLCAAPPRTWSDVANLARTGNAVTVSLAGPHALLTLFSLAVALGEEPALQDPEVLLSRSTGTLALDLLYEIASCTPIALRGANPIGILNHMSRHDDVAACPLIFGYVNYAAPRTGAPLRFVNAPCIDAVGRPGSTLGGTGIAISRRCRVTRELKSHLEWLMSDQAQRKFIPEHGGQPSRRTAWTDRTVNQCSGDFFRATAVTVEAAYVRPRYPGYIAFQRRGSALVREAVLERGPKEALLRQLQDAYAESRRMRDV